MIFGRRAGIVTLHVGVGLLMFGELLVSIAAVEEQISLEEGETVNYGQDIRSVELAVIDSSPKDADRVTAIPLTHKESPTSWLRSRTIAHHHFPFAIEIVSFFPNAELVDIPAGAKNPATAGIGRHFMAKPIRSSGGAGESEVDLAAAYVRLRQSESGEDLGTYLISQVASLQDRPESVSVDGQTYRLFLRFRRNPKQYQVTLLDVRKDDYIGTDVPQNYSSDVRLTAEKLDFDTELHISMNNPVRFAGETLYQSGYNFDPQTGKESSTIQVVTNIGWMIPYVACGIVMVGMLAQFSLTLLRFLQRQDRPTRRVGSRISLIWIGAGAALGLLLIVPRALPQRTTQDEFHLAEFGMLPVAYEGRVKPLDTVARTSLRFISGKETVAAEGPKEKTSAIEWLTDVIAGVDHADEHRIFKIDNRDLLFTLKLRPRKRNRFSLSEIEPQMGVFREQVRLARAAEESENTSQTAYHRKAIELNSKIQLYFGLRESFRVLDEDLSTADPFVAAERITRLAEIVQSLNDAQVPYAVPAYRDSRRESRLWEPLIVASSRRWAKSLLGGSNQPAAVAAYADQLVRGIQKDDKRLAQVVHSRMLAMIQEIRGQQMGGVISRADAEAALDRMPAETRLSVEQSLREKVIRELEGVRVSLTAAIRSLSGSQNDPINDRIAEGYERALAAFRDKDIATFNSETTRLTSVVSESQPKDLQPAKVRFESYFNHVSPFVAAIATYLIALIIATIGLLPRATPFRWTAMGLILITFGFHTLALMGRVYISGRPPVTNLYSVAIFIAWGCVLLGLIFELFFRVGVGNLMATVSAPFGLLIAHILSTEVPSHAGDTMKVMQAVLDTQFWLSTHVIIVTFGYVATVVAGLFGLIAVCYACITRFLGKDRKVLDLEESTEWSVGGVFKTLIYATLCIGIFLSFVGTVLGGLWADDSWGRFWGWDPKENGALMIVLWTALVLHARWGGLVQNRGLAVLAIAGNLMVGWSMFGVNELGVGLHSYGFTEGVLFGLGLWWIFNLIGIGVGLLIPRWAYQ